jgi:SAM-dependent methyltransferase
MHGEVLSWVAQSIAAYVDTDGLKKSAVNVLEIGSLDINGSVRSLFDALTSDGGSYLGIDVQEGPGVDVVADASVYESSIKYDIVVCAEVFEHTPLWPKIVKNAHSLLEPGGMLILTMAGEGRPPHSAIDENPIRSWEYYKNVSASALDAQLKQFSQWTVDVKNTDTRGWAIK